MTISIHAPTRGATPKNNEWWISPEISIHAPTRGATYCNQIATCLHGFQSTLPQGERLSHRVLPYPSMQFQSTLPQGERPLAPLRQNTSSQFQSTLPQGERLMLLVCALLDSYFNPRSHKGSDAILSTGLIVKIDFNPRSHKGSDSGAASNSGGHGLFQSTLPQGERHGALSVPCTRHENFNPRSHKGSDQDVSSHWMISAISIHAPTRGATAILHKIPYLFYFIFTNPFPISYFHTQPASDF